MFASKNLFLTRPSGGAYQISRSVRLRSSASAYLSRTPASATNQKLYTYSAWFKRGSLSANMDLLSAASASNSHTSLILTSSDSLQFASVDAGATQWQRTTTQVLRDPSAWYHLVVVYDSANATAANRVLMYLNGAQITAFSTNTNPALNRNDYVNSNVPTYIGRFGGSASEYFDGYFAEINFIDGQALTPSSFGAINANGVWSPARYTGTYGTNGFYLNFSSNGTAAALGTDFSGNSNTWTVNNISVTAGTTYDSMTDVPTLNSATAANYAVINPLNKATNTTITNGNLLATNAIAAIENVRSTMFTANTLSYWECTAATVGSSLRMNYGGILSTYVQSVSNTAYLEAAGPTGTFGAVWNSGLTFYVNGSSVFTNGTYNLVAGDVIQFAHDSSTGKIWLGLNGTWYNSGNPAAGTGNVATLTADTVFPAMMMNGGGGTNAAYINFGQRPFTYTPPTGFLALNTYNLSAPAIANGAAYMAASTYTGTGATQSIVNSGNNPGAVSFQPDFVWVKGRSGATDHALYDSVRGTTKDLASNTTAAETTQATGLTAFNSNGFTVGALAKMNTNTATYVGWQWLAGAGSSSSNTSGSITSTVSVNATAGFSVVTYTGTGANATVGHSLGVAPSMVIVKRRDSTGAWPVRHTSITAANTVYLNTTAASASATTVWNSTAPTSTVFSIGTSTDVNASTGTYVAYCFSAVAGYSAFGSYTGNGSTDGPFVYLGFRPRFILYKRSDAAGDNWRIIDTSRDPYNVSGNELYPNLSSAEVASGTNTNYVDILSNGFKVRNPNQNVNGGTYIYAAFAENPFKYALAR